MDLSIIIVAYNNNDLLEKCVNSFYKDLLKINQLIFEIVIIENGNLNQVPSFIKNEDSIHWIHSNKNLGYGKGNNLGFNSSKGSTILVLNPDIEISSSTILKLFKSHNEIDDKTITSCQLQYPDGKHQENRVFSHDYIRNAINRNVFFEKFKIQFAEKKSEQPIGFVGALLMFNRSIIDTSYIFDPCFFMYDEETEFCRRMFLKGCKFNFQKDLMATHLTEGTIENKNWMLRQKAISRMQYIRISFSFLYFLVYLSIAKLNIVSLIITLPFQKRNSPLKLQLNINFSQIPNYFILIFIPKKEFIISFDTK